jgi:hypothetical protein
MGEVGFTVTLKSVTYAQKVLFKQSSKTLKRKTMH